MSKKDKKLAILLLAVALATLLIIYFAYFKNSAPEPITEAITEEENQALNLEVLDDPRFQELEQRGQLTFPEEIGKTNPFNQ